MQNHRLSNLRGIQTFEAVSRHLSISRAAEELGVTQSAVSHQLRRLTEEIGERLIERSGRGVSLTEPGIELANRLQTAFAQIRTSLAHVAGHGRETVRLAVCSSFAPGWLIGRLRGFIAANPDTDLQLLMYAQDPELTDRVADAFVTSFPTEPGFWSLRLMTELLVPVRRPRSGEPAAGERQALITTDTQPSRLGADWIEYFRIAGETLDELHSGQWLQCSHYMLAIELARNGLGAALVPDFLAAADLRAGRLELLGPHTIPTHEDYYLCVKHSRRQEPAIRAVIQWFRGQIAQNGD